MRNRAKCKLCNEIIESFLSTDLVLCSCGEISVGGGAAMRCSAKDFKNFVRIDDEDNEVAVKVVDKDDDSSLSKEEKLALVDDMIHTFENLPDRGLQQSATNYDILALLYLLKSLFSDC